jgi:hypothetical protein
MRPESKRNQDKQFTPKWRHFHPQATLYMRNPFSEDIIFQVADEHNEPMQYRLPANKVCELPGGAIATLGLKEVVDRMIGESKTDAIRIWEPAVRERYEEQVIVRVKEAPQRSGKGGPQGEINLASGDAEENTTAPTEQPEDIPFPDARPNKRAKSSSAKTSAPDPGAPDLSRTAAASLGQHDQVIEED